MAVVIGAMLEWYMTEKGLQFSAPGGRITYSSCARVSFRNRRFEILRCVQNDELCLE